MDAASLRQQGKLVERVLLAVKPGVQLLLLGRFNLKVVAGSWEKTKNHDQDVSGAV